MTKSPFICALLIVFPVRVTKREDRIGEVGILFKSTSSRSATPGWTYPLAARSKNWGTTGATDPPCPLRGFELL